MAIDFSDKIAEASKNITSMEQILGKGLAQPFNGSNAGARKLMFSVHRDHILPLMGGEKAVIETGYEIRFGDYSSSITRADSDYEVVAKISKFSFAPNHHYWLILRDIKNKRLDVVERISYHHITESYGYLYNNEYMDNLEIGNIIPNNTIVQKSLAFDEYNNRKDGMNFNVAYFTSGYVEQIISPEYKYRDCEWYEFMCHIGNGVAYITFNVPVLENFYSLFNNFKIMLRYLYKIFIIIYSMEM